MIRLVSTVFAQISLFVHQTSLLVLHTGRPNSRERLYFERDIYKRHFIMPPLRSARNYKPPPDGFDDIEDTLLGFSNKMRDAENSSHEGKKRHEVLWPIFQITHESKKQLSKVDADCETPLTKLYI